ncbi:sugar ABC transporter substrate-binding protein [Paenibacillus terrigena]|uniref:ABC transporter substrate-binding protein n=1 Tax=Paenibacillus terrigena TaxID=369333 RepID=UPI0028D7C2D5|nr:sugar ABC transporter substrate-binding protein [Paenibacillus terrigena]
MKRIPFLIVMMLIVGLLAACGASNNEEQAGSSPSPSQKVEGSDQEADTNKKFTLKIVSSGNSDDGLDIATEIYKRTYPNATIEVITSPWGDGGQEMRNKELILLSSGQAPDIGKMVWGKEFFKSGVLEDITDEVKTWEIYSKLSEGQKQRITYKDKIFGITMGNNSIYLFYNKDILSKVGVTEPPKTIEELTAIAKAIKDQNLKTDDGKPIYATNFEGGNWATDYWLWSNGGQQMNEDYTKTLIDSPESIAAFQMMGDFVKNGWAPKVDGTYDQMWLNGQIAFFPTGDWGIASSVDAGINVGYALMPAGSSGQSITSLGGVEWGVFKNSNNKKEALDFLKVMVSDEYQMKFSRGVTDLAMYDNAEKQAAWKEEGALEAKLALRDQMRDSKYNFLEAPYLYPDGAKVYKQALERVLVGLEDPEKVMKEAAVQINKGIEEALQAE